MAPSETFDLIDIDELPPASRRLLITRLAEISDGRLGRYKWRHDSDLAQSIAQERTRRGVVPVFPREERLRTEVVLSSTGPTMTLIDSPSWGERLTGFLGVLGQPFRRKAE